MKSLQEDLVRFHSNMPTPAPVVREGQRAWLLRGGFAAGPLPQVSGARSVAQKRGCV